MNIEKISAHILYSGVNDRRDFRFEGLWPLPYGVSYNSYLVRGSEAVAIVDTVEITEFADFKEHLERHGVSSPDYLVVHHMEPDHSGSVPMILDLYPGIKIVCSAIAKQQIGGFFGITDDTRFKVVGDGEELSLGDVTLKFVMTPMVHWPETMMSYVKEDKVLFSGDAFGCFGALDGGVIDEQMNDISLYIKEMYRYYANIVGKYGKYVQAAMAKASGLDIDYICSTHGPVWHRDIAQVLDLYDRMSRYESEPGVVLVYGSMYGNTEKLADEMVMELSRRGVKNVHIFNAANAEQSDMIAAAFRYDTLIVGSPTYSMGIFPPVETFVKAMSTREVRNKRVAVFGSYTWAPGAMKLLVKAFEDMGLPPKAKMTMKQGFTPDVAEDVKQFIGDLLAE